MDDIYLVLENGKIFKGKSFGKKAETVGELVFTTGMVGYIESLTDPSYYGQMLVMTFPLIGNYGVINDDFESKKINVKALIVREWCKNPSNFRSEYDIDTWLKKENCIGIYGIDTRELTKIIRESGVMNAKILTTLPDDFSGVYEEIKNYKIENALEMVSVKDKKILKNQNIINKKVVLWDFGYKKSIAKNLCDRGAEVIVMPYNSSASDIINEHPDGIMLSNGPGDPSVNTSVIENIKEVVKSRIPIFGICLGHQLLALAEGGKTEKLKYGHRGVNQPVKEIGTGKVYISCQNHGYAVSKIPTDSKVSFYNVNDNTCEGINYNSYPMFSVQFHPEACGGARDTNWLFDKFFTLMEENLCHL